MNNLVFADSIGLVLNGKRIKHTFDHHWKSLIQRLKGQARIILTNEINLNANVENCGQMYAFHVPRETGKALLQHGEFQSRVSSWRMLGSLTALAGKTVSQSTVPTTLGNGDIILLVYRSSDDAELSFMVSYAHETKTLQEVIEDAGQNTAHA